MSDLREGRAGDRWRQGAALGSALVWLHQGLWCKVLSGDPAHRKILAKVPGLGGRRARVATTALGLGETVLAGLVATRGNRRWVAGLQTGMVVAFNAGGLVVGRRHIPHPARLLTRNAAFVAVIWSATGDRRDR
jgi:hypothetical protein